MAKNTFDKRKKVALPAGAPESVVIQNIDVRSWNRTEQDIPNWRRAIVSAESQVPRRNLLYNLYADVELDGHVESVTGKRRDAVTGANWQFVDKNGKAVDVINNIIDTTGFDEILEEIINARFWGYSIMEPRFWLGVDGKWQVDAGLIPRLFYRPEIGVVAYQITGDEGINIREGIYAKTIMEVGKVKDMGLYMKAAPYQILKRGGTGDYAAFIQTFGSPLLDATWDGFDQTQRQQLLDALNNIGPGGVIIRPEGTTIDIKENNVHSTSNSHDTFLRFLNKEISKALLGSTETTESSTSSGYAQSETHSEEDDRKHENDITYTRKVLNSRFITILNAHGFDTAGGEFIIQGEDEHLTKKESFDMVKSMVMDLGLPVAHDYFYENYGIPKPDNYDRIMKEKEAAKKAENEGGDNPKNEADKDKKDPKKKEPKPNEDMETEVKLREEGSQLLTLFNRFKRFFVAAPAETTGAEMETCGHLHTITLADNHVPDHAAIIQRIWDAKGKAVWDAELFWSTSGALTQAFKEGWDTNKNINLMESPGFVYDVDDPAMLTAFEQNLFRFSGVKVLAEVAELNQLFKQAKSFEEFYQMAMERLDVFNKEWLRTEYNTAVLTGEATATYNRLMAQSHIFPYWEYRTAGDHLVRPEHAKLNGLILPFDDPRWKKIFPPNGWNCRCYIVPRLPGEFNTSQLAAMRKRADAYINSTQFAKEKAMGWGVNRADSKEVFTANQQYARKFPGMASKTLNALKFNDYGLKSYSQARKAGTTELPLYKGDFKSFYEALEEAEGAKVVLDYHKRPITLQKGSYNTKEALLANAMKAALEIPNEVWLSGADLGTLVYVRYYQGKTLIALGKIKNGVTELRNWFELGESGGNIGDYRKGLLVYKK